MLAITLKSLADVANSGDQEDAKRLFRDLALMFRTLDPALECFVDPLLELARRKPRFRVISFESLIHERVAGSSGWYEHIRGLRESIPSDIVDRHRAAIVWILDSLVGALRSTDKLEDIYGNQRQIAHGLARFCKAAAPERHSLGKALQWISRVSPLAIRENRQRWIITLARLND